MAVEWTDDAIVLSARPHGESAAVVSLLTEYHGRHAGLLRLRKGNQAGVQAGNAVSASWRARLSDQLGNYTLEPQRSYAAEWLDEPVKLAALQAACAVAEAAMPEREVHAAVYRGFCVLAEALAGPHWPAIYIRWELGLLAELGYGLDLTRCAATGANDQLAYVSPRTGRAVSLSAGEPYRDRLLKLPGFMIGQGDDSDAAIADGLALTGYFIERVALGAMHKPMPPARLRFVERLTGSAATGGVSSVP